MLFHTFSYLLLYFPSSLFLYFISFYISAWHCHENRHCNIQQFESSSVWIPPYCPLTSLCLSLQVGEIRAHAAEWTANVSAEFKETRRRVSVEIYDKFQRATSIKRKLSSELGFSPGPEFTMPKRAVSVSFNDDKNEREAAQQGLTTPLTRNGGLFMNGLDLERGDISVIEHLK